MDIDDLLAAFLPGMGTGDSTSAAGMAGGMPSYAGAPQQPGVGQAADVPLPQPRPPQAPQGGGMAEQAMQAVPPLPPANVASYTGSGTTAPYAATNFGQEVPLDMNQAGAGLGEPSYGAPPMPPPPPPQPGQVGGPANVPMPPPRPPQAPQMPQAGQPQPGIPLPPPRPPQAGLPPNAAPTAGVGGPAAPLGPPMSLAPPQGGPQSPPVPPFAQPPQAPAPRTGPFGMSQSQVAGLGAGLKSVGQNWNKPGLAALAGSAGSDLEAGAKTADTQSAQHFNQMSTSFKDMLASKNSASVDAQREAQAKYLTARATVIAANGGQSSAYQNTAAGKFNTAELRTQAYGSSLTKSIDAQVRSGQLSAEEAKAAHADADAKIEQYRQRMYQGMGINPQQAQQEATRGLEPPTLPNGQPNPKFNPFDTSQMQNGDFNSIPNGAWYKTHDGQFLKKLKNAPTGAPQNQSEAEGVHDDNLAMAEQAGT